MLKRLSIIISACCLTSLALAATPEEMLAEFSKASGQKAQPDKGQVFFNTTHGKEWSCSSCHGNPPTSPGKHASTSKAIDPLAPSANPDALTDSARTDKWFRRNCNDVLGRECLPQEKADVLSYLISIKK